ncbi:RdgB/HAM1 family non-canonical purine NTP pyrophosphatase [Selenomonas sputigena]|uniref:dITP/XTP pyrophosphatase n=1 Tax=Selenomonas sputigena TaxID=69823 RepID=A0ABV3X358_9FIRM
MKKIVVATKNEGKVREILAAFQKLPVELLTLKDFGDLPEAAEDADTFEGNARSKAAFYAAKTGMACLADDSGLEVEVLDGAPGVRSARFSGRHDDAANNEKLAAELQAKGAAESAASFRCVLVFRDADGEELVAEGACIGCVRTKPRGTGGFGYDPYFYLASGKTMAELTLAEKQAVSHRGAALRLMAKELRGYLT